MTWCNRLFLLPLLFLGGSCSTAPANFEVKPEPVALELPEGAELLAHYTGFDVAKFHHTTPCIPAEGYIGMEYDPLQPGQAAIVAIGTDWDGKIGTGCPGMDPASSARAVLSFIALPESSERQQTILLLGRLEVTGDGCSATSRNVEVRLEIKPNWRTASYAKGNYSSHGKLVKRSCGIRPCIERISETLLRSSERSASCSPAEYQGNVFARIPKVRIVPKEIMIFSEAAL